MLGVPDPRMANCVTGTQLLAQSTPRGQSLRARHGSCASQTVCMAEAGRAAAGGRAGRLLHAAWDGGVPRIPAWNIPFLCKKKGQLRLEADAVTW